MENLLIAYARHFPIRRGKLRAINSIWRITAGNKSTMRLATLRHGGLRMRCDISEMLQRQFYFFGSYFLEEQLLYCWEKFARESKVIFDVGAHAGIYSLVALANQRNAVVHAFEPTAEIADRLRENANLNALNQLHIHKVAVFNKTGFAELKRFRGDSGSNEGMNFICDESGQPEAERVPTVSLDEFCEERMIDRIDLLKLDIQGHEYSALLGAGGLIKDGRIGTIFLELNQSEKKDSLCPATECIRLLEEAGYRFSKPGKSLDWRAPGEWLWSLSDVICRSCGSTRNGLPLW